MQSRKSSIMQNNRFQIIGGSKTMSEELNNLLKKAYHSWKDDLDPPIPLETIKEYLVLEGVHLDEDNSGMG